MTKKILIVEDDRDFAASLELALDLAGLEALVATSAEEACRLVREGQGEIRVGFFDIKLPGEDGISCFESIRAELPELVGVVMTGFRDEKLMERARSAGAVEILLKPFRMVRFMELAKNYVGQPD